MPIEELKLKCGHYQTKLIYYGDTEERSRKVYWYENSILCEDCWLTKKKADREQQRMEAKNYLTKYPNLPELLGTEKQISWADTIRAGILSNAEKYVVVLSHSIADDEASQLVRKHYPLWYADLCGKRDAAWWIDKHIQTQNEARGKGYFFRFLTSVWDGGVAQNTAIILWTEWLSEQPDVIEYWERMQIKITRIHKEYRAAKTAKAAKEAYIKAILGCLDRVDWQSRIASDNVNKIVSDDSHIITVAHNHSHDGLVIETIDGSNIIEFDGEFACRIDLRPEVLILNTHISAMWRAHNGNTEKMGS
ncbi:MAG: hypothetical protein WC405_04680 [Syntrophales bacterium]